MLCLCSWYSSLHIIRLLIPCSNYFAMIFNWTLKWNSVTMGLLHLALERFNLCYFFLQLCYLQWIFRKNLLYTDSLLGLSTFLLQLDSHSFYYLSLAQVMVAPLQNLILKVYQEYPSYKAMVSVYNSKVLHYHFSRW